MHATAPLCIFHVDLNYVSLRPDRLRAWLPRLAGMGFNAILWEVEDKVRWETCADAVWPEALGKREFRAILDEAAGLGLEPIPLLQTIGHGEYVLLQPAYARMRELPDHHDCYCTENPEVRAFLKRLIAEYLDLFGDVRHFHLGGDEAYVFGRCPVCHAEAARIGRNALYARHIMDLAAPIRARGARAGIWGDMVLNHPDELDAIPKDLAIWDWNYWDVDGPMECVRVWGRGLMARPDITPELSRRFPDIVGPDDRLRGFYTADGLKRMGFDVFLCSAARSGGDSFFCPRTRHHSRNIIGAARKAARAGLLGTCVTDWAIRLNSWETHAGCLPLAAMLLANPDRGADDAIRAAARELFSVDPTLFLEAVEKIGEVAFPFSQANSTGVQWNGLKDGLAPPANYIRDLLAGWEKDGRLARERDAIGGTVARIAEGVAQLHAFTKQAPAGGGTLAVWNRAAALQLDQARMAQHLLGGAVTPDDAATLRGLKRRFADLLALDQTPASASRNAGLVYDCLIEYAMAEEVSHGHWGRRICGRTVS